MKTLLIIPAYNEAKNLPGLLKELRDFPQYDSIVIDDCSQDNTKEVAEAHGVTVIRLPINLGLTGAVQTGMWYGKRKGYDICIQIDGDGQHVPSEIAKLVDGIASGYDIVSGSRFLDGSGGYQQTGLRALGARHISRMIKLFSGVVLTDPTSGMRAFNYKYFSRMALSTNNRPEPDTMLQFAREGAKIKEVQVEMREREHGESYLTLPKAARYMIENTLSFLYVVAKTRKNRVTEEEV